MPATQLLLFAGLGPVAPFDVNLRATLYLDANTPDQFAGQRGLNKKLRGARHTEADSPRVSQLLEAFGYCPAENQILFAGGWITPFAESHFSPARANIS